MTDEELRSTIEQIKAQVRANPEHEGKSDDEFDEYILDGFYKAFEDGKLSKEELGAIAEAMGYELTEEFENAEGPKDVEGMSKETLENTRTMEEGESKEDFKEKIEDAKEGEDIKAPEDDNSEEVEVDNSEEVEDEDEFENEDEEKKKASELWKMKF